MTMQPLVSVIVPVYKVEGYIERCARSLFDQTLDNIEYIFVDDCSPDNSIEVLQKVIDEYPQRKHNVKIIRQEKNGGVARARATGFLHSKGEYIIYCDSDDWVDKNMYKTMYDQAVKQNAEVVICNLQMVFANHSETHKFLPYNGNKNDFLVSFVNNLWGGTLVNLLIKRSVYDRLTSDDTNALFRNSDLNLSFTEDFHLAMRLLCNAEGFDTIDPAFYYYDHTRAGSAVNTKNDNFVKTIRDSVVSSLDVLAYLKAPLKDHRVINALCNRIITWAYHIGQNRKEFKANYPSELSSLLKSKDIPFVPKTKIWTLINLNPPCKIAFQSYKTLKRLLKH